MIRVRARYQNQALELERPLELAEGTELEILIPLAGENVDAEKEAWTQLGMSRLEQEWDNPQDAIYDNWKKLYGVQGG